jgi:hypothetical protein
MTSPAIEKERFWTPLVTPIEKARFFEAVMSRCVAHILARLADYPI